MDKFDILINIYLFTYSVECSDGQSFVRMYINWLNNNNGYSTYISCFWLFILSRNDTYVLGGYTFFEVDLGGYTFFGVDLRGYTFFKGRNVNSATPGPDKFWFLIYTH